jgi:hypothetical protein
MKRIIATGLIVLTIALGSSCYKNYYDITEETLASINNVSFRGDVVPIITSGACGCHNNGTTRQVQFTNGRDTIYYSAILSRSGILGNMANGEAHPGEGSIFFTPSQAAIIKKWVQQGAKDDYVAPPITGSVTYSLHIVPIYKTDCKGSSCHGGVAAALDYTSLKAAEPVIKEMMGSQGASGHPGGTLSISSGSAGTFLAWIAQGYKN